MITSKRVFLSERLAKVHPQDGNVNITINAAMKKEKKIGCIYVFVNKSYQLVC